MHGALHPEVCRARGSLAEVGTGDAPIIQVHRPAPAWIEALFGLAILPRRLAAALRRRLGRDQEVGDVGHPRPAVAEADLPDTLAW